MLNCEILSSQKVKRYQDLKGIVLPGLSGQLEILPGHTEIFVLLKEGVISVIENSGEEEVIQISRGECHVKDDNIKIFL